jgi:hypothetical protein
MVFVHKIGFHLKVWVFSIACRGIPGRDQMRPRNEWRLLDRYSSCAGAFSLTVYYEVALNPRFRSSKSCHILIFLLRAVAFVHLVMEKFLAQSRPSDDAALGSRPHPSPRSLAVAVALAPPLHPRASPRSPSLPATTTFIAPLVRNSVVVARRV